MCQPRPGGRVLEAAVPAIPVEHVPAVVGEEQVRPAVVVVVTGAHARGPAGAPHAGGVGHVLEGSVPLVPVQPVGRRGARGVLRFGPRAVLQTGSAERQRIQPPVVVVVDEGHAGAVGLDDEPLAIDPAVHHRIAQARTLRDIGKGDGPARRDARGGRRRRLRPARAVTPTASRPAQTQAGEEKAGIESRRTTEGTEGKNQNKSFPMGCSPVPEVHVSGPAAPAGVRRCRSDAWRRRAGPSAAATGRAGSGPIDCWDRTEWLA